MATTVNDTRNLTWQVIASLDARERGAFVEVQPQEPVTESCSHPSRRWLDWTTSTPTEPPDAPEAS
jgi:hypothetical protein